jgi:hypothetical protein
MPEYFAVTCACAGARLNTAAAMAAAIMRMKSSLRVDLVLLLCRTVLAR